MGGSLQVYFDPQVEPGLSAVAGLARQEGLSERTVAGHVRRLPAGLRAVTAPGDPAAARAALDALSPLWKQARTGALPWLVDVGRIDPIEPGKSGLWLDCDLLVLVTHGGPEALSGAHLIIERARTDAIPVILTVVGESPYTDGEISEVLRPTLLARLPHDQMGASVLRGSSSAATLGSGRRRWWQVREEYPLIEAARALGCHARQLLPGQVPAWAEPGLPFPHSANRLAAAISSIEERV